MMYDFTLELSPIVQYSTMNSSLDNLTQTNNQDFYNN